MGADEPTIMAVHFRGCPPSEFPELAPDTGVMRVALEGFEDNTLRLAVATNLAADLPGEAATRVVGLILHQLAHALIDGATLDLTAPATGGAS